MSDMSEMSRHARQVHDFVVSQMRLELQPGLCEQIVSAVLEGHVTEEHAEQRYQDGVTDTMEQARAVGPSIEALKEARQLLQAARAWQGPEEWRDEQVARIDQLLARLAS